MVKRIFTAGVLLLIMVQGVFAAGQGEEKESITLKVMHSMDDPTKVIMDKAISDYEKLNPNIDVEISNIAALREYEKKMAVVLPSGSDLDVFFSIRTVLARYHQAGLLSVAPKKVTTYLKNSVEDWAWKLVEIDDDIYGVPFNIGKEAFFWNKEHFSEAGISAPPVTWDEMVDYSRKLVKYNTDGRVARSGISLRLAGASGVAEKFWIIMATAGGSEIEEVSPGKWRNGYNNAAGRDTLKLHIDLLHKYKVDDWTVKHDVQAFGLGMTSMFYREAWVLGYMAANAPDVEYGVSLLPYKTKKTTIAIPYGYFVPESSKHKTEAWDFILFTQEPEYVKEGLRMGTNIPARTKDIDFSDIYRDKPQLKAFVELPHGWDTYAYPFCPVSDEVGTRLGEALEKAYKDESLVDNPSGIKKAIEDMAKTTDSILKEAGLYGTK